MHSGMHGQCSRAEMDQAAVRWLASLQSSVTRPEFAPRSPDSGSLLR